MAAYCAGCFGVPSYRYRRDACNNSETDLGEETAWVIKRYTPIDLRATAPVPRHKPVVTDAAKLPAPLSEWVYPAEASPYVYSRRREEREIFHSYPSTRCEEWSTLRQMLPSRGRTVLQRPANWGTDLSLAPYTTNYPPKTFPHINSPMTR